jgi:hypothetical protein
MEPDRMAKQINRLRINKVISSSFQVLSLAV